MRQQVVTGMSMSLDGFVGVVGEDAWPTHERILEQATGHPGAYVIGWRMFDTGEVPRGETPPFRAPVFVLTPRPRDTPAAGRHGVSTS